MQSLHFPLSSCLHASASLSEREPGHFAHRLIAAVTSVNFVWFRDFESIPWSAMDHILKITYPLNFSQNVITTGLITFKIYREHRLSVLAFREDLSGEKKDVITTPSGLNFVTVIQIIVESAVIYTILMGLLIILIAVDYHPSQVILQHLVAPITGTPHVLRVIFLCSQLLFNPLVIYPQGLFSS